MASRGICEAVPLLLLLAFAPPSPAATAEEAPTLCAVRSVLDSVMQRPGSCSLSDFRAVADADRIGVVEGDEAALQRVLNFVHRNNREYVAVLFYASWCPFSKITRPNYQMLASLFPTVRHFAFEESVIRPSILSRYGVHGFPTLFLLNSTMRVRYHGPRTLGSLFAFYHEIAGVNPTSLNEISVEEVEKPRDIDPEEPKEQEYCPFSWARSPEKLLQQDTYLALAICFLVLRLLTFLLPNLIECIQRAWRRQIRYACLTSLCDHLHLYFEEAKQNFKRLNLCKRGNFQERAINAREWATKSIVSVSLGESSSGKVYTSRNT